MSELFQKFGESVKYVGERFRRPPDPSWIALRQFYNFPKKGEFFHNRGNFQLFGKFGNFGKFKILEKGDPKSTAFKVDGRWLGRVGSGRSCFSCTLWTARPRFVRPSCLINQTINKVAGPRGGQPPGRARHGFSENLTNVKNKVQPELPVPKLC